MTAASANDPSIALPRALPISRVAVLLSLTALLALTA